MSDIKLTNKDLGNMSFVHFFEVLEREEKFAEARNLFENIEKISGELLENLKIETLS